MLVLSRRPKTGDKPNQDRVTLIDTRTGQVIGHVANLGDSRARLGFDFPETVLVLRTELTTKGQ